MARYYEETALIEFIKQYTPTIEGETTMKCVVRAIHNAPTSDVVPKGEVAREIFKEMQSCLMIRHWHGNDILTFEFDAVKYAELKKKYTEGEK